MRERDGRILEFGRILEMLAEHAVTECGKKQALALRPSGDHEEVSRALDETEQAREVFARSGGNPMPYFPDAREAVHRAGLGGVLSMGSLLDVATVLRAARSMKQSLSGVENAPCVTDYAIGLVCDRALEEDIFDAILSEEEMSDRASAELYNIRRKLRALNDRIRDRLNSIAHSPNAKNYLSDTVITMRNGRYVVPVRADARGSVPGIVHDQSSSGNTLFVEPQAVVDMGNDIKKLMLDERKEIDRILSAFSARCADVADGVANDIDILSKLDVIFARACLAREMNASPAKLNRERRVKLLRARHPLIDPDAVVPSTIWLGGDFTCLIITGPNTGGKTVTLKTLGLLALMNQAGLAIPADFGSELPVFDEVFADIGDEQSIEQSLSTFSGHMRQIVDILHNVTDESLVLFDELGAGTDPAEGAALAQSIISHLLNVKALVAATTHYSELKVYAMGTKGVENASVEFDVETLRPTYRLSIGIPGKSNAFEISRKLGLPDFLIENAQKRLTGEEVAFEDVIANAEYNRRLAEKEREQAEKAHLETQKLMKEAERLRSEIESKRESEMKKARDEARAVLLKARREADDVIRDLKGRRNTAETKEHELQALRGRIEQALGDTREGIGGEEPDESAPESLEAGDTVRLVKLGTNAVVLTPPNQKGDITVQAGPMKMKSNIRDVRLVRGAKQEKPKGSVTTHTGGFDRAVETECDVRGMNLEEAVTQVDLFIDGAVLNRLRQVYIIHGKGTGILRKGIQEYLKKDKRIAGFRLGKYGEGEDGVTVADLK